jgi:hypothetical protein
LLETLQSLDVVVLSASYSIQSCYKILIIVLINGKNHLK